MFFTIILIFSLIISILILCWHLTRKLNKKIKNKTLLSNCIFLTTTSTILRITSLNIKLNAIISSNKNIKICFDCNANNQLKLCNCCKFISPPPSYNETDKNLNLNNSNLIFDVEATKSII